MKISFANEQYVPLARVTSNEQVVSVENTRKERSVSSGILKLETYAAVRSAAVVRENFSDPAARNGA